MTANAGYHVYNTGDVLTAAQVQYNLQNQTIMWFATTSARDTALTGVLVDGLCAYTPATGAMIYNGTTWIPYAPLTTKGDVYGFSTLPTRVPVGTNGQVLTADNTQASGLNWTANGGLPSFSWRTTVTGTVTGFASNGTTIWVAYGTAGFLTSSTDSGVTWTTRTSTFGANDINFVNYGNGIFVACGGNGTIATSTDGITWTLRAANVSTNALYHVAYLNSNWVAVGAGAAGGTGGVTTSTDAITWTKQTTPASSPATLYSVAFGGTYYLAVGAFSTTGGIYSTNLTAWTACPTSLGSASASPRAVFYYGSSWLVLFYTAATPAGYYYNTGAPSTAWANATTNGISIIAPNVGSANVQNTQYAGYIYYGAATESTVTPQTFTIRKSSLSLNASGIYNGNGIPIVIPNLPISYASAPVVYVDPTYGKYIYFATPYIYTSF